MYFRFAEGQLSEALTAGLVELQKVHQDEWERYLLNPTSHPDYPEEYDAFQAQQLAAVGFSFSKLQALWAKFWPTKMREIHDQIWRDKVDKLQKKFFKYKTSEPSSRRKEASGFSSDSISDSTHDKCSNDVKQAGANVRIPPAHPTGYSFFLGAYEKTLDRGASQLQDSKRPVSGTNEQKSMVTVSSVLQMALRLKDKLDLLGFALPIITSRVLHAESTGYNPLDAIDDEDHGLLTLVSERLSQLAAVEVNTETTLIARECNTLLKVLLDDVKANIVLDIRRIAIETMDMDGDSILKNVIKHLVNIDSNQNPLIVYPAVLKEHTRMKQNWGNI